PARLRDPVVVAAALARLLHPAAAQPTAVLQPVEGRVQGGEREAQRAAGAGLDLLGDLVAVQGPRLHPGQDQQLRAALLGLRGAPAAGHAGGLYEALRSLDRGAPATGPPPPRP